MHSSIAFLVSALFALANVTCVLGSIYVTSPLLGSSCHGGQPCTVQWLDDGQQPLLNTIGECTVGLYANEEVLVQSIRPIDVSSTHSFQFTPDPNAGPNSSSYYIAFTSSTMKSANGSSLFTGYSPTFTLDQMTGSFDSPIASDTAAIPAPVDLASTSGLVTATTAGSPLGPPRRSSSVGPATTTPSSASPSPSGFSTVTAPSSSAPTTSFPVSSGASTTSSSATGTTPTTPLPSSNVGRRSASGQSALVLVVMGLVVYSVGSVV